MKRKIDFDILESLRGLAALYVCVGHCRAILWIGGSHYIQLHPQNTLTFTDYAILGLNMLTRLTTEFVIVFFVLSGFSIAHSLRTNFNPRFFYKRRIIRLYPPFIIATFWAMLVVALISYVFPHFVNGTYKTPIFDRLTASMNLFEWKTIFLNFIYLPDEEGLLKPFWSLTQEVIFYLLAPFVFRNNNAYYIASFILFIASQILFAFNYGTGSILMNFLYFNFFFAFGAFLYNNYEKILKQLLFVITGKGLLLAAALFFLMIPISLSQFVSYTPLLAAIMSSLLILYLVTNNTRIPWLIGIGKFSYTLYITHYASIFLYLAAFYYITDAEPPYIFNNFIFIPAIFFCLLVAYLQYYFIEKKTKSYLDRLRAKERLSKGANNESSLPYINKTIS